MLKMTLIVFRRLRGETRGSEIAEAAAVLPMAFMMVLAIFWFGQAFRIYGTIAHAARQGARAGAAPVCTICPAGNTTVQNVSTAVQNALVAAKLDPARIGKPNPTPALVSCTTGAAVACVYTGNVCVQQDVQLSTVVGAAPGVCGVSVSFQYPYQFWLPFTTLNMQKIQLRAIARMRMEKP